MGSDGVVFTRKSVSGTLPGTQALVNIDTYFKSYFLNGKSLFMVEKSQTEKGNRTESLSTLAPSTSVSPSSEPVCYIGVLHILLEIFYAHRRKYVNAFSVLLLKYKW